MHVIERKCNQCLSQIADHKESHIIVEFIFRIGNIYNGDDHKIIYFDIKKDTDIGWVGLQLLHLKSMFFFRIVNSINQ